MLVRATTPELRADVIVIRLFPSFPLTVRIPTDAVDIVADIDTIAMTQSLTNPSRAVRAIDIPFDAARPYLPRIHPFIGRNATLWITRGAKAISQ